MKNIILVISSIFILNACANMVAPTGGDKDTDTPKLLSINDTKSMKHVHTRIVTFDFDELIVLNNWEDNFYISPPINKRIQKKIKGTELFLTIEDTLAENATYNLALNSCIKDLNEGNILDSLNYTFSTSDVFDILTLSGKLQDAYTLESIKNAWIMLFTESRYDSVIFKENPNYIAKTDENGNFNFPNLDATNYKAIALTEFDFIYNETEKIAFLDSTINPKTDSFICLFSFDPIVFKSANDTATLETDSSVADTLIKEKKSYGKLEIITAKNSPCIFQLLQNGKIVKELISEKKPFIVKGIIPGKYQLKYIYDLNEDGDWNTGNWKSKTQPEKVVNYPSEITIRSNWDLELEWTIEE